VTRLVLLLSLDKNGISFIFASHPDAFLNMPMYDFLSKAVVELACFLVKYIVKV
jgi:hypothetical protein